MDLRFGFQSYQHVSRPIAAQRMINCYLEATPPGSKTQAAVVPSFGIRSWVNVGTGVMRGGRVINGIPYVVAGTGLYRVAANGTSTLLGTIPNSDVVSIAGDGTNILVISVGEGYLWNGASVSAVADVDFPENAAMVEFLDGYAIVIDLDSGRVWINESAYVWSNWNALDFATSERSPDDMVSIIIDHGEVFLFGKETIEVWRNTGNADFPLEPLGAGIMEVGCLSRFGPAKCDNTVFFPGHDGIVYRLDGYTPIRISHHGVEQAIQSYFDKTCYGMTWSESGHKFYSLTFADGTWVYDLSTQLWHERQSFLLTRWKPQFVLRAYNKWLVGDYSSNKLGELDPDTFAEWGDILRASCTSGATEEENKLIRHSRLELVFDQGVGLTTGQGSDPKVMLDWSNDGGRTWAPEQWLPLGAIGEFKKRSFCNRLGMARDRVYRYAISDPVRRTLVKATLEAEVAA